MEQLLSQSEKRLTLQLSSVTMVPLGVIHQFPPQPVSTLDSEKLKNIIFLYLPILPQDLFPSLPPLLFSFNKALPHIFWPLLNSDKVCNYVCVCFFLHLQASTPYRYPIKHQSLPTVYISSEVFLKDKLTAITFSGRST